MSGKQIAFSLALPVRYSAESFVTHAGVIDILERFISGQNETVESIVARERSGKTHFLIHLASKLEGRVKVTYVASGDFDQFFIAPGDADLFLLDDVDQYLKRYADTGSGPLVGFIEFCRARSKKICLTSTVDLKTLDVDPHLRSRFNAIVAHALGDPDREELKSLVKAFASQRALKFEENVHEFLQLRMPKSIPDIEAYFARLTELSFMRSGQKVNRQMLEDAL